MKQLLNIALPFSMCLSLVAPASAAEERRGAERQPNIVFILADDLGWTDVACYGSRYYETPHIDRLAQQGMRFTHGYTCGPNCQPTRAALMTGQYGARTGIYTVGGTDRFDTSMRSLVPVENVTGLEFFEDGRLELFDLRADPGQQHDLAAEQPDLTRELHAKLKGWREQIHAPMPTRRNGEANPAKT